MSKAGKGHVGSCRLCGKTRSLQVGHVVPAFVYRWLKATAALPYLRSGANPNIRLQDGWKRRWFCQTCEQQIGRFERAFADNLFPLIVAERPAPYQHGPWLSRFIASVVWRTQMLYSEREDAFDFCTPEQTALLPLAAERWRAFVRGEVDAPGIHELHLIPMATIADFQSGRELPPNFNRYTLRAIEINVGGGATETFAFVKMGPAVALGFFQPPPPGTWEGTVVAVDNGQVGGQMHVPIQFLDYLIDRAKRIHAAMRSKSPRQREKIAKALLENIDRAAASETIRATHADVLRFGMDRVFPPEERGGGQEHATPP
jgi:hypothetical protein